MSTKDIDAKHDADPLVGVGSSEGLGGAWVPAHERVPAAEIKRPTIARAPTLEDFCDAANDLYAAPTEERFLAVVNLARESLILRGQAWQEGFGFGTSGQRDELFRLRQQLAAARLALVQYGAHDGACAVCDIDDEGRHCACDCGYEAAIKAAEDKTHNA